MELEGRGGAFGSQVGQVLGRQLGRRLARLVAPAMSWSDMQTGPFILMGRSTTVIVSVRSRRILERNFVPAVAVSYSRYNTVHSLHF